MRHERPIRAAGVPPVPAAATAELIHVADEDLDALFQRITALHDDFKRHEFVFRVVLGHELLQTLHAGLSPDFGDDRPRSEGLARFYQRHRAALDLRDLSEATLRRCVRVAEFVPDPHALPEHVTFSHLAELIGLPPRARNLLLKKLLKKPLSIVDFRELVKRAKAEQRAEAIADEERDPESRPAPEDSGDKPGPSARGYVGNVPRRVDGVLNEVLSVSRDLAPDVVKRPEVAGEALEKWLKVRQAADWWVRVLQGEGPEGIE